MEISSTRTNNKNNKAHKLTMSMLCFNGDWPYNSLTDCTFWDKLNPIPIEMAPTFQLHRHKCIHLRQSHTNDRIVRILAPKVGELCKQWCVLPAPNASAALQPVSMSNYQDHYFDSKKKSNRQKIWKVIYFATKKVKANIVFP